MRSSSLAAVLAVLLLASPAGAAVPVRGDTSADRKAGRDFRAYLAKNASDAPWYSKVLEIRVSNRAITVRTALKRSAAGRAAAKQICQMIQGSDVADFTPGHRVTDRKSVGIRRCPPRRV